MLKKHYKKLVLIFLSLVLIFCAAVLAIRAEEATGDEIVSETIDGMTWTINKTTGLMTVEGNGSFSFGYSPSETPYYDYFDYIKELIIYPGITELGESAFDGCANLTKVTLPDSMKYVAPYAFAQCVSLNDIDLGNGITYIAGAAFGYCSTLTNIDIPPSVTTISSGAFAGAGLEAITIPDTVTNLDGRVLFYNCKRLKSVSLPRNNTTIGYNMFEECIELEKVVIPKAVKFIKDQAFYGCKSLTDVYYSGTEEEWNTINIGADNTYLTKATIHFNHIHSYKASGVEPTAELDGEMKFTCVCGDFYKRMVPALGFTPKGEMTIDYSNNTIYGLPAGIRSLDKYTAFTDNGYMWAYANIDAGFGTGTVAILLDETSIIGKYTILIYGDVDGNGWYDANDAFIVNMIASGLLSADSLTSAQRAAADCNHDGVINELDFNLLMDASLLKNEIDQLPEETDIETNAVFIQYNSIIDQSAGLTVENEPEEAPEISDSATENTQANISFETIFVNIFEFIKQLFDLLLSVLVI